MMGKEEDITHLLHLIDQFSRGEYHRQNTSIGKADFAAVAKLKALGQRLEEVDRSRRKVEESEAKYRSLFQHAPIGIAVTKAGHLVHCNDTFLKQAGYQRADLKKIKNASDFYFNPDDRKRFLKAFAKSGKVDQWDVRLKRKDGSPYDAWLTVVPFVFEGESCMMSLVEDITDQKLAKDRLRDSEARNKTMVENVQEAILLFEPEKKSFIGFNQNALDMFGYSQEEFMNMTPVDLSPPEQPDGRDSQTAILKNVQLVMKGKHPGFEWVYRAKDGRDFICEAHLTKIPYADRKVIMASLLDISQRKDNETERENLIQELDRFIYSASHDLSAPLKSILGLVNLIRTESDSNEIGIYLDMMEKSIGKLEKFIQDIIKYSRNSHLDVDIEDIELEQLVQEVLDNLKFADGFGSIKFKTDFKKMSAIKSDRFRLKIVLNNLISNSIKFRSPRQGSKPFVQIKGVLKDDTPVIEIHDNGQGIEEEVKDKIFNMFFRGAVNSTGSGLGLYIAKEAAENINCQIRVESEVSKGSIFSLIFSKNGEQASRSSSSKKPRERRVEV